MSTTTDNPSPGGMAPMVPGPDVLTLTEAAAFLRVSEDTIRRLAVQQALPGRQIDDQWRFLKSALADWLRERSGKSALLSQAGALCEDQSLAPLRETIYQERGRPETEAD
ncbi:MAG: helix-turn-helix domain-containing protein [Pirellulales bacterium]|nr:helix-turn-helix domain-containing protein [Pirellulales bacterium]